MCNGAAVPSEGGCCQALPMAARCRAAWVMLMAAALAWPGGASTAGEGQGAEAALKVALGPPARIGLGQPLTPQVLVPHDRTVFPDGRNLPPGQGGVAQGAAVYRVQCAMCHGARGVEGPASRLVGSDGAWGLDEPLRFLRMRDFPLVVMSVGARWPYATTVFDYVRRAMPHHAPKSLGDDDVYAVTAFLLHAQGLVPADAVMNAKTLPQVQMPGLARTRMAWPPGQQTGASLSGP